MLTPFVILEGHYRRAVTEERRRNIAGQADVRRVQTAEMKDILAAVSGGLSDHGNTD
jgi:hypothetical protein